MLSLPSARSWVTLCAVALAGCGSPGSGGRTHTATAEERKAALDTLEPIVAALPPGSPAANTALLVRSIKALPQFADAGSSPDGTVWGVFTGGMLLFVVPPPRPAPPPGPAHPSLPTVPPLPTLAARSASLGTVPKSGRVRLFNGLGRYFSGDDSRPEILGMLQANGYTGTLDEATLGNLRWVKGDGIFYLRTHGGKGTVQGNSGMTLYALWTASDVLDPAMEAQDAQLTEDLVNQRVVYMLFRNDFWSQMKISDPNRHYGITGNFVSRYMSFDDDSLVYIDACNGANDQGLRDAFKGKNASLFVGWDERARIGAIGQTAKYVFDRLLGANKFVPEAPQQRPFPYDALERDPRFGSGKTYGYSEGILSDGKTKVFATLHLYTLGGQFAMLAPSIFGLQAIEAQDELMLLGSFGPNPGADGKVTIGDSGGEVALAIKDWSADGSIIRANLPRTGAGSSGSVVVSVRGHHSNTRQLIAWDGTFTHTLKDVGTLTQRFDLDVRLRIDPHDVRNSPGEAPYPTPLKIGSTSLNAAARWEAAGTYTQPAASCTFTHDLSGTGTIPANATFSGRSYLYAGTVEVKRGAASLSAQALDSGGGLKKFTQVCPPDLGGTISYTNPLGVGTNFAAFHPQGVTGVDLRLDGTLNITGDSRQGVQPSSLGGQATLSLRWPPMAAKPPYDSTLPR